MQYKKMRGVVDPYGLGFLIGIVGALITFATQPHFSDDASNKNAQSEIVVQTDNTPSNHEENIIE